jgi:hypothetical protein
MRLYCPQWCHRTKGWIDLPMLADKQKKPADDAAEEFAQQHKVATRVIKKPHGWKSEDSKHNVPESP